MEMAITAMQKELQRLKNQTQDGSASSADKFQIAWYEDALERSAQRAVRLREECNLGKRFESRTFDTFDASADQKAYDECLAYAERDNFETSRNSLLILGGYGTGKTHLAAAIANRLIDNGIPVLFDTYVGHLNKLKAEMSSSESKGHLERMKKVPMLILDDVGKEKQTEWTRSITFDVVNYRYEHMTPMVITSNLLLKDLEEYLGGACYSRLCEICSGVVTSGKDYRRKA